MLKILEAIISALNSTASRVIKKNIIESLRLNSAMIAFTLHDEGGGIVVGNKEIRCHMISDIKMKDFCQKAHYVAVYHATVAPPTLTYASVVLRESVHIALTLAALNDM